MASWKAAWGIFISNRIPFASAISAQLIVIWWLRGFISGERINALEERLRLAHDIHNSISEKLTYANESIAELTRLIQSSAAPEKISATVRTTRSAFREVNVASAELGTALSPPAE